jgi:hypothetical protein
MKFIRLGMIAAMAMAFVGQQAMAADAPAFKIDPKIHEQSMKDAPALVQATNLPNCTVSDAYLLGTADEKANGKTFKNSFYEIACSGNLGYIFKASQNGDPGFFDCVSLKMAYDKAIAGKTKPGNICQLPANADPKSQLKPWLDQAAVTCPSVSDAAWLGASATDKINVFEAACGSAGGYLITAPMIGSAKKVEVTNCIKSDNVGIACTLTSKEQALKPILAIQSDAKHAQCAPTKARYVVTDPATMSDYYELGCADGKTAYIMQTDAKGAFKTAIECVQATRIAGGCTYMDVNQGSTADTATYTKLAKQIGYEGCASVSKYQSYGSETGGQREIVELSCGANEGGYAMVPTGTGQTGEFFNCVRASGRGLTCHLTPLTVTYAKMSQQVASRNKYTCAVDGARDVGKDDKGQEYVEVTCGAKPSLVLTYSRLPAETMISAVPCAEAPIANACTLKK